ncbi:DUF6049 family protein [Umezawaea sp. Da 62-37]|uniref:DUF6049 family protein n=1 Tax=Umezawaea sp. Da 62-37 TaxID=3075927 RepID=UPI0028F71590|nr:DUF6049 family protein [Umezawaea sp. Da 62-37]WNV91406.1 DUF6049 family protein [Umezawaea sp. Da 62-37]
MKRLLSALAAAGLLVISGAAAAPALAAPADGGRLPVKPAPATQVWATRQLSQPGSQSPVWLRMEVDQLVPRAVTGGMPNSVKVTGKIFNVGDRKITEIDLRLERGDPLTNEEAVKGALREPVQSELVQPAFTPISESLEAGQSAPFSLDVPLSGDGPTSLQITEPGIYPILANVNGKPDFGGRARLAALSTLLPVLSVPGGGTVPPPPNPAKVTVLWPLVDRPRLVTSGPPGEAVLTDDDLAQSLSLGGRLHSLLKAYDFAVANGLASSVCVAVDPDLLRTVEAMSKGYRVRDVGPGRGQNEAKLWLDQISRLTAGRCVMAVPYADADLVALSRAKLVDLGKLAVVGAEVVQDVLGQVQALPGVVWPEDGLLDKQTMADLTAQGVRSVVLDQSGVADAPGTQPVRLQEADAAPVTAVRIDSLVSDALRGGTDGSGGFSGVSTPTETKPVSVQNALAALTFRAGFQGNGQNVVVSPPRRWNAPVGEMQVFLETVKTLVGGGYLAPVGLDTLVSGATVPDQVGTLAYPVEAGAKEVPPAVTAGVGASWATLQAMFESMSQEDSGASQPADLVDPLRLELLRGVSGAWRGNDAAALGSIAIGQEEIGKLQGQVMVIEPNSPILLGSGDSPVPVTIKNKLDVRINVRIVIEDKPGIKAKQLGDLVLPARGDRLVRVPVEVLRSGRFSVNVLLTTPNGVELGETVRLEVSSSAYGTITIVITATAAAALVLLSARRIYRRVRASRRPAVEVPEDASSVTPEKSSTS